MKATEGLYEFLLRRGIIDPPTPHQRGDNVLIEIDISNDAFQESPGSEVARILRDLADQLDNQTVMPNSAKLRDVNGNAVGVFNVCVGHFPID
jgi:hypothetical protein